MTKLKLYMETTRKEPEETAAEIQKLLKGYNLKQFMYTYDKGEISGMFFQIEINNNEVSYRLPVRHEKIIKCALEKKLKYCRDETQARRVAWRQVLRWIEAQTALIQTGIVSFEEVFLPYMLIDNNTTTFEKLSNTIPQLTGG